MTTKTQRKKDNEEEWSLRRGSRGWWHLSKTLCCKSCKASSPPLRSAAGAWVLDPQGKAQFFADEFVSRWSVPEPEINEFTSRRGYNLISATFVPISSRRAKRVLSILRADSGAGPDGVPARVLKICCQELTPPFVKLARRIVATGEWPRSWTEHWIHPLFKRKSAHDAVNYRGIHLTSRMSKAMERLLCHSFVPRLISDGFYGTSQYAYTPRKGVRDAVLWLVLHCLTAFSRGQRIGLYRFDVSGAFDRVKTEILLRKLAASCIPEPVFRVIRSWLAPRTARIVVNGAMSELFRMSDMVFHGTV